VQRNPLFREQRRESAAYCCKASHADEKVYILKKRKWHGDYITYGFYRTKEEMLNPYPSAHYLFCTTEFGNSSLAPGHLKNI